jgi:hypothetical protein
MRQRQARGIAPDWTEQQQVEVQGAGRVRVGSQPTVVVFDGLQVIEQVQGIEAAIEGDDRIQEVRPMRATSRLRGKWCSAWMACSSVA